MIVVNEIVALVVVAPRPLAFGVSVVCVRVGVSGAARGLVTLSVSVPMVAVRADVITKVAVRFKLLDPDRQPHQGQRNHCGVASFFTDRESVC